MNVIAIMDYDSQFPDAVVVIEDGENDETTFVKWYRSIRDYAGTDQDILDGIDVTHAWEKYEL